MLKSPVSKFRNEESRRKPNKNPTMKKFISYALVLSIVFISACSKDEVAGPQGEQGIQGPQGPAGSVDITVKTVTLYPSDFTEY